MLLECECARNFTLGTLTLIILRSLLKHYDVLLLVLDVVLSHVLLLLAYVCESSLFNVELEWGEI